MDKMKCTRIVIAHRLSTIKNCDRILMLDKDRIIEDGTYDELIAKNGSFAELVERQRLEWNRKYNIIDRDGLTIIAADQRMRR